jgi:hypothetical protein
MQGDDRKPTGSIKEQRGPNGPPGTKPKRFERPRKDGNRRDELGKPQSAHNNIFKEDIFNDHEEFIFKD